MEEHRGQAGARLLQIAGKKLSRGQLAHHLSRNALECLYPTQSSAFGPPSALSCTFGDGGLYVIQGNPMPVWTADHSFQSRSPKLGKYNYAAVRMDKKFNLVARLEMQMLPNCLRNSHLTFCTQC
jgi:hypothetical protein